MDARISDTEAAIIMLEYALGLGGLLTAGGLLMAPDGQLLGWTTESLQGTPLGDYVVPALMVLALTGILPLIVATAALRRRPWSTWGHLALGSLVVAWIGGQLLVIGYISLLQPIFAVLGFALAALALVAIGRTRTQAVLEQPRHGVAAGAVH